MRSIYFFCFVLLLGLVSSLSCSAAPVLPTTDIDGAKDSSYIGRFDKSIIISFSQKKFDEMHFPLSELKINKKKRDGHNNSWFEPEQKIETEGKRTRLVYLIPPDTSSLEVIRNYERSFDGEILYQCKEAGCGGDYRRGSNGGGGHMSLSMYLMDNDRIKDDGSSIGGRAQKSGLVAQRYRLMKVKDKNVYVSILAYTLSGTHVRELDGRTVAVVDILEEGGVQDKMVTIDAKEMAKEISEKGSVALYGIYFDSGKAKVKPESKDALVQVAAYLHAHPHAKLLVVGHTDTSGSFEYNADLSKRRADAVVKMLGATYSIAASRLKSVGVSYACPVATNATEEGRARNRRVELVADGQE